MQPSVELWRTLIDSAIDPAAWAEENRRGDEVELSQLEGFPRQRPVTGRVELMMVGRRGIYCKSHHRQRSESKSRRAKSFPGTAGGESRVAVEE